MNAELPFCSARPGAADAKGRPRQDLGAAPRAAGMEA